MSRIALYARVSSDRQARDQTIDSQIAAIQDRLCQDGLTVDPERRFVDDGYSGSTMVRPALENLRDQASAGAIDILYVHHPDRLARRYVDQVVLIEELQAVGVQVIFLNRPTAQSPEEAFTLQTQGIFAEYERAKILERSRRGKLHAAKRGSVNVLAHAPYGYRYIPRAMAGGEARFDIHLEEARIVRQMFHWVAVDRLSISEVARRLKAQRIPSPKGRDYWDRGTVWGMLRNPAYQGTAAYGKTRIGPRRPRLRTYCGQPAQPRRDAAIYDTPPDQWQLIDVPAIVEPELFQAVARQLQENRERQRLAGQQARYLLQGLVVCGICGHAMCGRKIPHLYYRCVGNVACRMTGKHVCHNRSIRGEKLEQAVWEDLRQLLAEPRRLEEEYQRRLNLGKDAPDACSGCKIHSLIQQARRQINRLIDAYGEGLINKGEFDPRIKAARSRLERLEADARAEDQQRRQEEEMRLVIGHLESFASKVRDGLQEADWDTRREVLRMLIRRIEVHEQEVRVVYRVNGLPFERGPERAAGQDCWRRREAT